MTTVPYRPTQSVLPSGEGMQYLDGRVDPNAFGAGIGRALSGLGDEVDRLNRVTLAREEKGKNYSELDAFYKFQNETDTAYNESQRSATADGSGYLASWQAAQAERTKAFEASLSPEGREKYAPQLTQFNYRYTEGASKFQWQRQDQSMRLGIGETIDQARTSINTDGSTGNTDKWLKAIDAKIDSSTLPDGDVGNQYGKATLKRLARDAALKQEYVARSRGDQSFAQSALGVVPKGGFRETDEDRAIEPASRQTLVAALAGDKDAAQHIDKMQPRFANSLARFVEAVPGLTIYSGARSRERQQELWDASDKSGTMVGSPDGSKHVHGEAADLRYNGKRLDELPREEQVRLQTVGKQFGLAFPLDTEERRSRGKAEPWHVEDAQARQRAASPGDSTETRIAQVEGTAQNPNSSARGIGQFTKDTWYETVKTYAPELAAGKSKDEVAVLRDNPQIAREMLGHHTAENKRELRSAGFEQSDSNTYLLHFLGKGGGLSLLRADPNTPVSQVLGGEQIAANRSVLEGKTAGQVIAWADRKMGEAPALGASRTLYASRPMDPRYAGLSFDDRVAMTNEAVAQNQALAVAETQALAQQQQANLNTLLVGINDGTAGEVDFQEARKTWLGDYDDIQKVQNALKARDAKIGSIEEAVTALGNPLKVWDPTDSDDKKRTNALFDAGGGAAKLAAMDTNYLNSGLLPFFKHTGMVPQNAIGTLTAMARSQDPNKFNWAMSAIDQMARTNYAAASRDMNDTVKDAYTFWNSRQSYAAPAKILEEWQNFNDPSKGQVMKNLREEGAAYGKKEITDDQIVKYFGSWVPFTSPAAPDGQQLGALRLDFNNLYPANFALAGGDKNAAFEATMKQLGTKWGASSVGGTNKLMKYPPNNEAYYKPVDGSWDWQDRQFREDAKPFLEKLGVDVNTPASLVADANTEAEVDRKVAPSYTAIVVRDGLAQVLSDDRGRPARFSFDNSKARGEFNKVYEEGREIDRAYNNPAIAPRARGSAGAAKRLEIERRNAPPAPAVYDEFNMTPGGM